VSKMFARTKVLTLLSLTTLALTAASAAAANAPTVTTGAATQLTYSSAVLAGHVNPHGAATEAYFEYGTTKAYGSTSTPIQLGATTTSTPVSATITGLAAYTTYDYRLVAVSANGKISGANRTFKTRKIPLSLQIDASPNPVTYGHLVTIAGTLAGTGNANQPVALQQNPYPYTAGFTQVGNTELTSASGSYSFTVPALEQSTQYRVVNVNRPSVISTTVSETVAVAVRLHARARGSREHPAARFSGTVAPASETDAKYAIQELIHHKWRLINGGITARAPHGGVVRFAKLIHFHHGGFFRVFVGSVQGANAESFSAPIAVRGYR
jgi:hypothetical protein